MLKRTLQAGILAALLAACSQRPDPAPAPTAPPARRGLDCPPPTLTTSLGSGSTGVRVRNESGRSLLVFLDECTGHRRLGTVLADRARLFSLPRSVYLRGSQVVLHTFAEDPEAFHSSHRHSPGPDTLRIAPVAVAGTNPSGPGIVPVLGDALFRVEEHPDGPQILLNDNQGRTTLRLWCEGTQPVVEVGGLSVDRGPIDAVLAFGFGERAPTNPWTLTDDGWIRSPAAFADPIITRIGANTSVQLQFQTPAFYVTMTFNTIGMDEAIKVLSCVGP